MDNRPVPTFYGDRLASFSTKKSRRTPGKVSYGLKPIAKTAPPISRVFPHRWISEKPQQISFKSQNESLLSQSKHYNDSCHGLYFEQCFTVEAKLGEGSFGEVFKVRSKEDGKLYAVKRAREKFRSASDRLFKLSEVQKHEQLPPHPNLVEFIRAWEERGCLYIQTELCHCSLSEYGEQNHDIPEKVIWNYLVDLLLSLKHLHDHDLVHMDVKPENIFISQDGVCKLGDFGLVFDLKKDSVVEAQEGDAKYLAPEILNGHFGKCNDIFSLGITILELACDLDLPNHGDTWQMLRQGNLPMEFVARLSPELQRVVRLMMIPDHRRRPTVDSLLALPCVQKVLRRRRIIIMYSQMKAHAYCLRQRHHKTVQTSFQCTPKDKFQQRQQQQQQKKMSGLPVEQLTRRLTFEDSDNEDIDDISSIHNESAKCNGFRESSSSEGSSDRNTSFTSPLSSGCFQQPWNSTPAQKLQSRRSMAACDNATPLNASFQGSPMHNGFPDNLVNDSLCNLLLSTTNNNSSFYNEDSFHSAFGSSPLVKRFAGSNGSRENLRTRKTVTSSEPKRKINNVLVQQDLTRSNGNTNNNLFSPKKLIDVFEATSSDDEIEVPPRS